jgi:hypothetical protein
VEEMTEASVGPPPWPIDNKRGDPLIVPVTNSKAWEAVTGFIANTKAAVEGLNKLSGYLPESKDHLIAVTARIEAGCDATG